MKNHLAQAHLDEITCNQVSENINKLFPNTLQKKSLDGDLFREMKVTSRSESVNMKNDLLFLLSKEDSFWKR